MDKILLVLIMMSSLLTAQDVKEEKATDPFIGEIMLFAGSYTPSGFLPCDGRLLNIADYSALYSLIGTYYGGDGHSTFALPDLRGRVPVGSGQGPGLSNRLMGERGGYEDVYLTQDNMPSHTHGLTEMNVEMKASSQPAQDDSPSGNTLAVSEMKIYNSETPDAVLNAESIDIAGTVDQAGNGTPHNNMMPYQVLHYCIAVQGVYP